MSSRLKQEHFESEHSFHQNDDDSYLEDIMPSRKVEIHQERSTREQSKALLDQLSRGVDLSAQAPAAQDSAPADQESSTTAHSSPPAQDRMVIDQDEQQLPTPADEQAEAGDELLNLGARSRLVIQTIQKLESLDISTALPSLPKFVVVGDQSAGKSSIIEALCDIKLPRSSGTCTRCPFQVTTTSAKNGIAWTCKISLQIKYEYKKGIKDESPFPDWVDQMMDTIQFAQTSNKDDLEPLLIRAQHAILNPRDSAHLYATTDHLPSRPQVQFSPNLICLDIEGPELPELSFTDLPGSINVMQNEEDQHLVDFVKELVKTYLSNEKVLILLACAADSDIENSTTFKFIRECSAIARCAGVITKADLLAPSKLGAIAKMLNGEDFKVGQKWYVTKSLSQIQLDQGISHAQARTIERDFFARSPWSTDMARFSSRFGTSYLQGAISQKLTDHIISTLPEIIDRVQERLAHVSHRLSQYRERHAHPVITVLGIIRDVHDLVKQHAEGVYSPPEFIPAFKQTLKELGVSLKNLAPKFEAGTPGYVKTGSIPISDDEADTPRATPSPAAMRTPGSRKRNAPSSNLPIRSNKRAKAGTEAQTDKAKFTIEDVKKAIHLHETSTLGGEHSPKVTNVLIKQTMQGWPTALSDFFTKVEEVVTSMTMKSATEALKNYEASALGPATKSVLETYLKELLTKQKNEIMGLLDDEMYQPFTIADAQMSSLKATVLRTLNRERLESRAQEYFDTQENEGGKIIPLSDRKKKLADANWIKEKFPADPFSQEIAVLTAPFAYYQVARARLVDNIGLNLMRRLVHTMSQELHDVLVNGLNATSEERCEQLLLEDVGLERQRLALVAEKDNLLKAMAELNGLPEKVRA